MDQKKIKEPVFICPACGNTTVFYETGLANVKMKLTFDKKKYIGEYELVDFKFIGDAEIACAVCGAKV